MKIYAVSGYSEVGRNMTCIESNNEAVILDMGIDLENYITLQGHDDLEFISTKQMTVAKAIPDISVLKNIKKNVLAIIPSHGHLDHIGAIPFLSAKFNCPIIASPYTASVIKAIMKDKRQDLKNDLVSLKLNKKIKLSDNFSIELVNMTHSIPQASTIIVHTPEGKVAYANDFKLDNNPTLGDKPNYKRLKQLGKEEIKALIIDSLYADEHRKTPSESIAKEMLRDVMLNIDSKGRAVIVSTFSSHIARLKSIIEFGKKMKRKIVFLGRSLAKYTYAAEDIGLVKFSKKVEICTYGKQIQKKLDEIEKNREKYLIVCTGHQAEPKAVLSKIATGKYRFNLLPEDHIIFSCSVIPSEINIKNRKVLEKLLLQKKVRIFKDIHQSGHGAREDHRELIKMLNPEYVLPSHAKLDKKQALQNLALEMGYHKYNVPILKNGDILEL
ncbi:RNase J family beta-CASP ribonuclease [archaeon]|nr:RNase J family beta-CASP ribonuclease [archaeon]MBT4022823.1 RNase J family beta-CASP ribonuclease [archaeon]